MFKIKSEKREQYYDEVIRIYKETGFGRKRIAKLIPISDRTIQRWINNFVAENGKYTPKQYMQKTKETSSLIDKNFDIQELQNKVKELESKLLKSEMRADFYEEMINVAEAKFKIPIRKKAGAKQ